MTLLTLIPFFGALLVALLPSQRSARGVGMAFLLAALGFAIGLALGYDRSAGGIQFTEIHEWIPSLNVEYAVGADGLSLMLLVLTTLVTPFAVLAAGPGITRLNVVLILLLETALIGTFTALNFIHWFLFYELSLVPAFLLIRSAGTPAATRAASRSPTSCRWPAARRSPMWWRCASSRPRKALASW